MDTEIAEGSAFLVEQKTDATGSPVHSDFVGGDDSDAKMTLAVTSDEDSRESARGRNCIGEKEQFGQKEGALEKVTEEVAEVTVKGNNGSMRRKSSSSSAERATLLEKPTTAKRKLSQVDWLSDEEDLLGFDEESGDPVEDKRFKKIKEIDKNEKESVKVEEIVKSIEEVVKPVEEEKPPVKEEAPETETVKSQTILEILDSPKGSPKPHIEAEKLHTPLSANKSKASKDSAYRKPFGMGWKREFVYRAIPGVSKEKGEVYYISPTGKKLRTRNELQQHITPGLTLDNFTFSKEPLGYEEEVIRSAKPTMRSNPSTPTDSNRESLGKRVPKPKAPKGASPPPQGWTASKAVKSAAVQSPRPAPAPRPPEESEPKSASKTSGSKGGKSVKKGEPCTIQCTLAMGMIPQLQCVKCLCLFHHECVGLDRSEYDRHKMAGEQKSAEFPSSNPSRQGRYICELCEKEPNAAQISPTKPVAQSPTKIQLNSAAVSTSIVAATASVAAAVSTPVASVTPPVQQQNPGTPINTQQRKISEAGPPPKELKQASSTPKAPVPPPPPPSKPSASHSNSNEANIELSASLPQSIAVIKGRKYVVIRKPSILRRSRTDDDSHNRRNENSTTESSTAPSLQTGDDLPVRKRIPNTRNKFSPDSPASQQPPPQQQHLIPAPSTALRPSSESFAANFFGNVSLGYEILFQIFQYLKVQELLRAACVCRVWYVVANNRSLWKTVRMKNSQVNDWTGLAAALRRNETQHLDLRKMLTSSTNADEMWASFSKNIQTVVSLETIDLCRCSSKIVESLFETNPNLKVINAVTIKDEILNLEKLNRLENLEELRLKSIDGCTLEGDLLSLKNLKNLRHLSLTSFRELGSKEIEVIGELTNLESLELGECSEFTTKFAENVLPKLTKLERLRLEKGQAECCTLEILDAIAQLHKLAQLEMVNFDVKIGFDEKLAMCKNIKRLLLIPTYISQSATTNNIVLSAVLQLSDTLQTLTWAVTLELLRVTALYVDQCDNKKKDKKFFDESIPVLKPVPGIPDENEKSQKNTSDVPQVEILPLVKVEKILTAGMPTTKFKILKVPYHFTWRQNLVDLH